MRKITKSDINVGEDVIEVIGAIDKETMGHLENKYVGFIDDINKHLGSLKKKDYPMYLIGASQNIAELKSSIQASLKLVAASKALRVLEDESEEFDLLLNTYTEDRAKALTNVLTSKRPLSYEVRSLTEQSLSAIGFFQEFLYTIRAEELDTSELVQNSISLGLYRASLAAVKSESLKGDRNG